MYNHVRIVAFVAAVALFALPAAFGQGSYNTAAKVTTAISNGGGTIKLVFPALPYASGSTFERMSEGQLPDRVLQMHRRQMSRMMNLTLENADLTLGGKTLPAGQYVGGFDIQDSTWSLVFFKGDEEVARQVVDLKKGGMTSPFLVIGLLPHTLPGHVNLAIHFGDRMTVQTLGATMGGEPASK